MSEPAKKMRLGDMLVQNEIITEAQLMKALAEQKKAGSKLGRTLIDLGYMAEDDLLRFLSKQMRIPLVQLRNFQLNTELVKKLPETAARRYRAIVLSEQDGALLIGMSDPMDIYGYDELTRLLKQPVKLAVVRESELLNMLDMAYRRTDEIASIAGELEDELGDDAFDLAQIAATGEGSEAPVVRLLESIFEDAVMARASDIHIEPDENVVRIRQRIDGTLHEQVMKEKRINAALVLRLKLMSGLNISEKRLPQDGRFNIRVKGRSIDVRLSTMPVSYGESVVMRLLDQSAGTLNLDATGMPQPLRDRLRILIHRPYGLLLVTGPTGSGKTTTLYGALSELNTPATKIITAEDPVEYRLPRITQVQINPKIGLSFATVLRSALRQDPDVVLVGEMRDQETSEIGLRAAMTGHFVLSTLHTNDSISSAMRLIDMGAEPFLVASALTAILAQRLVKRVCEDCVRAHELTDQERVWLRGLGPKASVALQADAKFVRGAGCYQCGNSGYKGRVGVYELLEMNEDLLDALRRGDQSEFTHAARKTPLYRPLALSALDYALKGITSLDEVFRITASLADAGFSETEAATTQAGA
ncbi:MAG: MSHA biogenesis protein MshE [unclassified Hahellaceae]|nr:MSHA biogenesis protein MshE [Hahellaceae bacterium]|tara:strand:- start:175231 stop:176994 length:1764 start_codon:yes stop_codon:yes gene_type:complete